MQVFYALPSRCVARLSGAQFNSFVEISTDFSIDFSTEFLVIHGVLTQNGESNISAHCWAA